LPYQTMIHSTLLLFLPQVFQHFLRIPPYYSKLLTFLRFFPRILRLKSVAYQILTLNSGLLLPFLPYHYLLILYSSRYLHLLLLALLFLNMLLILASTRILLITLLIFSFVTPSLFLFFFSFFIATKQNAHPTVSNQYFCAKNRAIL